MMIPVNLRPTAKSVMFYGLYITLGLCLFQPQSIAAPAAQGITLQATRVIYPANQKKGVTFTLKNDTKVPYLIQSLVTDKIPGQTTNAPTPSEAPFVVLPPLKRLASDESVTLTLRLTHSRLPQDRESVLSFIVRAIPAQPELSKNPVATGQVKMALALQNTLKLFYRPTTLPEYDVQQVADTLQFRRFGDQLSVTNPSAFYVTFSSLAVGSHPIDSSALFAMVPPFGKHTYSLPKTTTGEVTWQLVNDYGRATDKFRRNLDQ